MKKRESNIEILRIISMLLIISFHYVYKSGYVFENLNYNSFIVKTFYFFGELGVNLFILITGYFLVNGKFSIKKLIKLILEINFYYIFSVLLLQVLQPDSTQKITIISFFKMFFSVVLNRYWFATAYVLIYILSPYLNVIIHNIKQEDYKKLLLTLILLWSVIPTILGIYRDETENLLYYNRFIWLIVIYLIGAYVQLYPIQFFKKKSHAVITSILTFFTMILSIFVINKFSSIGLLPKTDVAYFWRPNTILMVLLSISIFEIFINIKINCNKIINLFASTTFAVYLLHDGPLINYIWNIIFKTKEHLNSPYSILYIIGTAIIIFIIGSIIDLIRQFIEKHTINKFFESKFYNKLQNKCEETLDKTLKLI